MKHMVILFATILLFACQKSNDDKSSELLSGANSSTSNVKPYAILYNPSNADSLFLVNLNDDYTPTFDTISVSQPLFKFYVDAIDSTWTGSQYQWSVQIDLNGFTQMRKIDNSIAP